LEGACRTDGLNVALVGTDDPHYILVATAHELAHTWGAQHVTSNTIMNAFINGVTFTFSPSTISILEEFAESNAPSCFVSGNHSDIQAPSLGDIINEPDTWLAFTFIFVSVITVLKTSWNLKKDINFRKRIVVKKK